jgi:hypothetical protein
MSETIQHFIDSGDRSEAWCHNPKCGHHAFLDMEKLRDKLGPDHGALYTDLAHMLRCSKCGGKEVGMLRHASGSSKIGMDGAYNYLKSSKGQ